MSVEENNDDLHRLIDQALDPDEPVGNYILDLHDTVLFERLDQVLTDIFSPESKQKIYASLRESYLSNKTTIPRSQFDKQLQTCRRCSQEHKPLISIGNRQNPDLYLVHDGPLHDENRSDLATAVEKAGFRREQVCVGFTARCMDKPSPENRANCGSWLTSEIQLLSPKLIMPIGSEAAAAFLGPIKITSEHGQIFYAGVWPIMPILSPYYCKSSDRLDLLYADFEKAYHFLRP